MKTNKILSALLMSILICIGMAATASAECTEHSYTNGFCTNEGCGAYEVPAKNTDDVYEIKNAGQLYWFAGLVNGTLDGGAQNKAANAILKDNIVLNANLLTSLTFDDDNNVTNGTDFKAWTPIGSGDYYKGTFDGNNQTISGLYFNDAETSNVGLFGEIGSGCKIKNLGVTDIYINAKQYVGGLCGYIYGGSSENLIKINNCYSIGTVNGKNNYIGGLCGYIYGCAQNAVTIENCYSIGTVNVEVTSWVSSNIVGGFCGYIYGTNSNSVMMDSCYSTSDVKANISKAVSCTLDMGGFIGYISGESSDNIIIDNCYSTSDITSDITADTTTTTTTVTYKLGGFCGSNTGGTIKNSYSKGTITTSKSSITDFVNDSNIDLTNCYYLAESETETSNGITGKTTTQFASGEVAYLLNGSTSTGDDLAWGQTLTGDKKDTYPVLNGKTVYRQASGNKYANSLITTAKNTEGAPTFDADTAIYDNDGVTDFKYDENADVTTVYVKIDGAETGVKPAITITGDAGTIENSQTWTAVDGTNIYYAQFIGDFTKFGTIEVTYEGAESVVVQSAATSEDE